MSAKSQTSDNHLPDGQDRQKPLPARHLPAYAIIAAAGSGSRMALAQNKQFLQLGGKSVITRTVYAFTRCSWRAGQAAE